MLRTRFHALTRFSRSHTSSISCSAEAGPSDVGCALHPRRHQCDRRGDEPARAARHDDETARVNRGTVVPSLAGGRGYLPRPWIGMAHRQCRPCEPRSAQGHVSHRELSHRGSRGPSALRGVCAHAHCRQLVPQSTLPEVPGCGSEGVAGRARGRAVACALLPRRVHVAGADRQHRLPEQGVIYGILFKAAAETPITIAPTGQPRGLKAHDPNHLGARIGLTGCCTAGARRSPIIRTSTLLRRAAGYRWMGNGGTPAGPASSYRSACCRGSFDASSCRTWSPPTTPAGRSSLAITPASPIAMLQCVSGAMAPSITSLEWAINASKCRRPISMDSSVLSPAHVRSQRENAHSRV